MSIYTDVQNFRLCLLKMYQIFSVSSMHVGSKTSSEFSICGKHPTRLDAIPRQMNLHSTWTDFLGWRGACSGEHDMFLCLLWGVPETSCWWLMAFGTTFWAPWTQHKESLVKALCSPLDLEKWSHQKNVLHVIVNMSMARISHHCWYSCYPKLT